MRHVRKGMPCERYYTGGDRAMKRKKKWYDYLWIVSLTVTDIAAEGSYLPLWAEDSDSPGRRRFPNG